MINLDLNTAINIISLNEYSKMTSKEIEIFIENEDINKEEIFDFIKKKYIGVKISYIQDKINTLYKLLIVINGKSKDLNICSCCNYKTILEKGNYEICPVCFWEDDGNINDYDYSSVNHMTLKEAKNNFKNNNIISDKYINFIDIDAKLKYYNHIE